MGSGALLIGAALAEIAGCYAFWAFFRLGASGLWLIPGALSLVLFAVLLSFVETDFAGRTFAIYGGVYIAASLGWMHVVEGSSPDRFDLIGALFCIAGAMIIMLAPRPA